MSTATATSPLLELCEPFFQYLCRLNRAGRLSAASGGAGGSGATALFSRSSEGGFTPAGPGPRPLQMGAAAARSEILRTLQEMARKAASDYRLSEQVRQIELPLKFFADSHIAESKLPFAAEWNNNRLAYDHNELAGDEKFFDIVEETLRDKSAEATERLAVYFQCLGLGFTGAFPNQVELLRKYMNDLTPRVQPLMDKDHLAQVCPEAYRGVDTTNLIPPESNNLVIVGILFACFLVAAFVAFFTLYSQASKSLKTALDVVEQHDPARPVKTQ
jgi:type VI protein secretion system component VasF